MPLQQSVEVRLTTAIPPVNINAVPVVATAAIPSPVITVGGGVTAGHFVSTTGSATGAGTIGDPWTLAQAVLGGYPTNSIQPGDTVWLRNGTYTGQFTCQLNGTNGNWITFRSYPSEWAIIDGVWDPNNSNTSYPNFYLHNWGSYIWLRSVELTNSTTQRYEPLPAYASQRGDGFYTSAPHSKVTGCVVHDCGQGGFIVGNGGSGADVSDNLVYHNGHQSPMGQSNCGAAVDFAPSGGTPVAPSGSYSVGYGVSSSATWAHTNTSGDYLGVAVYLGTGSLDYTTLSATYNGVAMTLKNGSNGCQTGQGNNGAVGFFTLASPATGTHNVVVASSVSGQVVRCIAQSLVNAGSATAAGTWVSSQIDLPPYNIAVSSASNHLVMDVASFHYAGAGADSHVNGDNTLVDLYFPQGTNNPAVAMSYAAGAATVNMGWTWTPGWYGHGHGMYMQATYPGQAISGNIVYDQIGDCTVQAYGSSSANFVGVDMQGNAFVSDRNATILGGLSDFSMTDTVIQSNYFWASGMNIGYHMADYTNLQVINNVVTGGPGLGSSNPAVWNALVMTGNTLVGTPNNFTSSDFPSNSYFAGPPNPTTNLVVVRPNPNKDAYDPWHGRVYVFNWENLTNVSVNISSMVPNGTAIEIMNAQDYHGTPVWSGTYNGGTVSLPMTGLSVEAGIGDLHDGPYTVMGATGPAFNAFIVRAQGA